MAQFSHVDFGGMSQWSPGMTMVGDMFNNSLKSKLDVLCTELAAYLAQTPPTGRDRDGDVGEVSYRSVRQGSEWWPADLGAPSAVAHKTTFDTQCFREDWQSKMGRM
jgi:hypothetical protein